MPAQLLKITTCPFCGETETRPCVLWMGMQLVCLECAQFPPKLNGYEYSETEKAWVKIKSGNGDV